MTQPTEQKPRGLRAGAQIGFFPWLRDRLYNVVYSEGDFALQFIADFFRGREPQREAKHIKRQMQFQAGKGQHSSSKNVKKPMQSQEKPLSKDEQKIFADILKRQASEKQVPYWKRKKALLNNPNKGELVVQHTEALKLVEKQKSNAIEVDASNFSIAHKAKRTTKQKRQRP